MDVIEIYTDGAARGNPGRGGYGVVLIWKGKIKEMSAGYRMTTNNRMELLAIIIALESLKNNLHPVHIFSDSKYVIDAITKNWIISWQKTRFKNKKNKDLWLRYIALSKLFSITYTWVKGHAENTYNNRCDILATQAADGNLLLVDTEYEKLEK